MKTKNIKMEEFNGVAEFLKTIGSRTPNKVFNDGGSLSSETGSESFTMTESYAIAEELMATGYKEGLEKLDRAKNTKIAATSKVSRNLPQVGIVGFAPHVPNAIAGIPQSMISTVKQTQKSKVISIVYDCTECCGVEAEDFVAAGRNVLDLIVALEASSCRVALDLMVTSCAGGQKVGCRIRVKDHRQPINPLKVSYTLIHPSFFRRQCFRWIETTPLVTSKSYRSGYGRALRYAISDESINGVRKYLAEDGALQANEFFTAIDEAKRVKEPKELASKMGIKAKIK